MRYDIHKIPARPAFRCGRDGRTHGRGLLHLPEDGRLQHVCVHGGRRDPLHEQELYPGRRSSVHQVCEGTSGDRKNPEGESRDKTVWGVDDTPCGEELYRGYMGTLVRLRGMLRKQASRTYDPDRRDPHLRRGILHPVRHLLQTSRRLWGGLHTSPCGHRPAQRERHPEDGRRG